MCSVILTLGWLLFEDQNYLISTILCSLFCSGGTSATQKERKKNIAPAMLLLLAFTLSEASNPSPTISSFCILQRRHLKRLKRKVCVTGVRYLLLLLRKIITKLTVSKINDQVNDQMYLQPRPGSPLLLRLLY